MGVLHLEPVTVNADKPNEAMIKKWLDEVL